MIRKMILSVGAISIFCLNCAFADDEVGKIVFDCYYTNAAWGYELHGVFIDSKGDIYKYNPNGKPWLPKRVKRGDTVYPQTELLDKYMRTELVGKIDKKILDEKIKLIKPASLGNILNKATAFDAGERSCIAFIYNEIEKSYRAISLDSKGDVTTINSAPEAQELYHWLQDYWKLEKTK